MSRRSVAAIVAALALASSLASCGTSSSKTSDAAGGGDGASTDTTLVTALKDTLNPDPDVYFDLEGVMVTNSIYESLVVNPPGSVETEGALAQSWTIAPDGLTYTFKLKPGIKFSDGTPIDSTVMKESFERRTAAAGSPSYMLGEVKSYDTPDPSTFVIHLSTPVNNFLARLASPWAPMATNPKVIAAQAATGDKLGSTYLKTHSAGSGPYVISKFSPDEEIVLTRNESYWGTKPFFKEVDFKIISDPIAQRVQLEAGTLDFIEGVNPEAADALKAAGKYTVVQPPAFNMTFWQVNTKKPPFSKAVLAALPEAISYDKMVKDVFGSYATVAKQTITANRIPAKYAQWAPKYDPSALKSAFEALPADQKKIPVETAYPANDNGVHRRLNDYMVDILKQAGFTVTSKEFTLSEYFGFVGKPEASPSLVVSTQPDDGVHPDNWYRIWMHTKGALNIGGAGLPAADKLFDQADATPPSKGIPYQLYSDGAKLVTDAGHFIPVADAPVIWVTQPDIKGVTVRDASDQALVIQLLRRGS
jgi:peptide/nickel transport system substrate-binding protein